MCNSFTACCFGCWSHLRRLLFCWWGCIRRDCYGQICPLEKGRFNDDLIFSCRMPYVKATQFFENIVIASQIIILDPRNLFLFLSFLPCTPLFSSYLLATSLLFSSVSYPIGMVRGGIGGLFVFLVPAGACAGLPIRDGFLILLLRFVDVGAHHRKNRKRTL